MRFRASHTLALAVTLTAHAQGPGPHRFLAFTANHGSNDVSVLDTRAHIEIARVPVPARPVRVLSPPSGDSVFVCGQGKPLYVSRLNLDSLAVDATIFLSPDPFSAIKDAEISPDGRWIAVVDGMRATLTIIDTREFVVASTRSLCPPCDGFQGGSAPALRIHFTKDGSHAWVLGDHGPFDYRVKGRQSELTLLEIPSGALVRRIPVPPTNGGELKVLGDSNRIAFVNFLGPRPPRFYDGLTGDFTSLEPLKGHWSAQDVEYVEDLRLLCFSEALQDPSADYLHVLHLEDQSVTLIRSPESVRHLSYNPTTGELWARSPGGVATFDLVEMRRRQDISLPQGAQLGDLSFTPDGRFLYYPAVDEIVVVETSSRAIVNTIPVGVGSRTVRMFGDTSPSAY